MWTLAWPWMLLALPLPFLVRRLLPAEKNTNESGLIVPNFSIFSVLFTEIFPTELTYALILTLSNICLAIEPATTLPGSLDPLFNFAASLIKNDAGGDLILKSNFLSL